MSIVVEATVVAVQEISHGYDQRIKILLARPCQERPVLPASADWYASA